MRQESPSDGDRDQHQELYQLMADDDRSIAEKKRQALEIGRKFLGVGNGYIQRRTESGSTDEIVASVGEDPELLPVGEQVERAQSYCRRTVESDSVIALSDVPGQGWETDPAYKEHGLSCYLGTTIFTGQEVYGTVCFTDYDSRENDFTGAEKAFVELIARLLGRELDANNKQLRLEQEKQQRANVEDRCAALLQLAPDAILVVDAQTGEIVRANRKSAELTGYQIEALERQDILELHPSSERDRYRELFESIDETTTIERFEDGTPLRIQRADSTTVPIELSTNVVEIDGREFVYGSLRDISARREREQELRVKTRAIDEASIGITIADMTEDDMPLVYANPEFERLTGYDNEDVSGENCRFLQGDGTAESTLDEIRTALATERPIRTEILNYHADGKPFWNELTLAPVREDGRVTHYVGFQKDVTARKRRDRSLEVLDRVLRHNLRNGMSVIDGFAKVIAEQTEGEVAAMAERIGDTASGLTDLSEKARELQQAMRDTTEPAPRTLKPDVETVVEELQEAYSDTEFRIDQRGDHRVFGTPRLRSALRELGENAATHAGGPVTYEIERRDDDRVAVHIRDTGAGLSDCEQQVIETGRETPLEHGAGLGLWLVNWLVTDIGGDVTTTVDSGTTVTVLLTPADQRDRSHHRRTPLSVEPT